jgi:hypothetical protein
MAHKCGFTYSSLGGTFLAAGFKEIFGGRRPVNFDLWLVAFKAETSSEQAKTISATFLP